RVELSWHCPLPTWPQVLSSLPSSSWHQVPPLPSKDIKPENLIVKVNGEKVKMTIIDLGAAIEEPEKPATEQLCTIPWASPQMHHGKYIPAANDAWSVGIMLFEMATGRHPFPEVFNDDFNLEWIVTSTQVEVAVESV